MSQCKSCGGFCGQPCKRSNIEPDAMDIIVRLQGEAKVMRDLLKECANLIATIDCESQDEHDLMVTLQEKIVGML